MPRRVKNKAPYKIRAPAGPRNRRKNTCENTYKKHLVCCVIDQILKGTKQVHKEIVFIFAGGIIFRLVSSVFYISKCELTYKLGI